MIHTIEKKIGLLLFLALFSCKEKEQPRYPVSYSSGAYIKESIEKNKQFVLAEEQLIADYIKTDSTKLYKESAAGYWYAYIKNNQQDTITPKQGDLVQLNYKIEGFDDKVIYDFQEAHPKEFFVDKENVFTGFRDAVKLMKKGEEIKCLFPSTIAYGSVGDKNKIAPNTPIIVTIKLINIKKVNQ